MRRGQSHINTSEWTPHCVRTEGRNLSTHLDLCVSSVTQEISRIRLRIVTRDPSFHSGGASRTHRHSRQASPAPATEGPTSLAQLQAPNPPWQCCDHQHARFTSSTCKFHASGGGLEVRCYLQLPRNQQSTLLHHSLTCCRGATRQHV